MRKESQEFGVLFDELIRHTRAESIADSDVIKHFLDFGPTKEQRKLLGKLSKEEMGNFGELVDFEIPPSFKNG